MKLDTKAKKIESKSAPTQIKAYEAKKESKRATIKDSKRDNEKNTLVKGIY